MKKQYWFFRFESTERHVNGGPLKTSVSVIVAEDAPEAFKEALKRGENEGLALVDMRKV
jgi:putative heme iron utilization protein